MQTASDMSACSGEISRPDPTMPVDPGDVILEEPLDPAFIESLEAPRSTTVSDGMLNLMVPGPDLAPGDDLGLLEICRPHRRRKVFLAIAMGVVTLAGILVALGAQNHLSGPRPAQDVPDTALGDVRLRVKRTAVTQRTSQARSAARKHRRLTRHQRVRSHLRRGSRAYRRGHYAAARREARRALKLDRRNKQARRLERRSRTRMDQQKRAIKRQLTRARRALKHRKWQLARRQARAILRKDPRNRQARQIKRLAEARLRRQRRG